MARQAVSRVTQLQRKTWTRTLPEGFRRRLEEPAVKGALGWLEGRDGIASLGLLLRVDDELAERVGYLDAADPRRLDALRESTFRRVELVRGAVEYAVPAGDRWREAISVLPAVHSCLVRAPVQRLREFLNTKLFQRDDVVAGILVGERMLTPEAGERTTPYNAATQRRAVARAFAFARQSPEGYLDTLGIGDFSGRWQNVRGEGQSICVLGSGTDESHPALQGQLKAHALFDSFGNYKEAKYAFDRGCHGTQAAALIAGRVLPGTELGLDFDTPVRVGVAPGAKIAAVNVLEGGCRKEEGTLAQLLAGIDWAVVHARNPYFGGYQVVHISLETTADEAIREDVNRVLDDLTGWMEWFGLVPLFAAGNGNPGLSRLGTRGIYVGAADGFGKPWKVKQHADLLAPGVKLACCQPPVPALGSDLVGVHTGTSLAASLVAGGLLLLREATGKPIEECLEALRQSAPRGSKMINLDRAYAALTAQM
jgi:hypothetical protein